MTFDLGTLQGFSANSLYSAACRRSSGAEEALEWPRGRGSVVLVKWCRPAVEGHSAVHLELQPHAGRRSGRVTAPGPMEVSAPSKPSRFLLEHVQKCSPAALRLSCVCLEASEEDEDWLNGGSRRKHLDCLDANLFLFTELFHASNTISHVSRQRIK